MTKTTVKVRLKDYPLNVVQSAIHVLEPRFKFGLKNDARSALVTLSSRSESSPEKAEDMIERFQEELLHCAIRRRVSEANQEIREHIVTTALLSCQQNSEQDKRSAPEPFASVLDENLEQEIQKLLSEIESSDGKEDPLKIAAPWSGQGTASGKVESSPEKQGGV